MTTSVAWMAPICALIGICVAGYLGSWVLKQDPGPDKMNNISLKIQQGAQAFLMAEYRMLIIFVVVVAIIMAIALNPWTAAAFVTGAILSAAAGYVGMFVATRANTRTTHAAEESVAKALNVSFKSGLTMGLCVASFALLGLSLWLILLVFGVDTTQLMHEHVGMVEGFATGASAVALFARVGGGIYTKAADVGADLVGKVEAGIPEDDPRNPATIADNVGDNVGDVAGMGSDLFESYTGSILAPTILAATFAELGYFGAFGSIDMIWAVVTPVIIAACGIITSIIGLFAVRAKEGAELHKALNRGTYLAAGLEICAIFVIFFIWNGQSQIGQPIFLFGSVISGLVAGVLIGKTTEYFCSDHYNPVHKLAEASETGAATNIIQGLSTGMLSTIIPILLVSFAIILAYTFGNMAFSTPAGESILTGLFGVGLAATGMLSNTAITVGVDAYGPVADNAGGIAEMSGLPEEVRERTDGLDAVGNTTAAIAKGFAISSAGLAAISLFVSYQATMHHADPSFSLSLTNPMIVAGIFIGAMIPFMFAALTMGAVSEAAHAMVAEVRRQFREIPGIMEYKAEPEYDKCVGISTQAALRKMLLPGLLAVVIPIAIGCFDPAMLGGFLAGAVATGMLLAIFMSNSGGAWDNAKKYIEQGNHGGKGSEAHKAAVVGDTVGDPFKDTSGPSMNILINLMTIISLTFSPLFIVIQHMI